MDDNNLNNMDKNQDHSADNKKSKEKADSNVGFYAKNIAFVLAGTFGAVYGITMLNDGFMYAGAGIVLIICGIYITVSGVRQLLEKRVEKLNKANTGSDNKSAPNPQWKKPKKKKKNKRKSN